ncbi:MAG: protein TolQ [Alphaproteobacteria bacterium]|nr:protein TolQ [Alphaproteobacteria bacterium]MCL2506031.1 protein TolQ [Alphaproteobacteria bacterium]
MIDASPVSPVSAVKLAGSVPPPDMSIMGLFGHADGVGKLVILSLVIVSIMTWAIVFDKMVKLKKLKAKADRFEEKFWSVSSLDSLFERVKKPADPFQAVFVSGMKEWRIAQEKGLFSSPATRSVVMSRIDRILQVTIHREMEMIETWMTFLASVGSVAPFIGLFGTVWGIMNSFIGIAKMQNTNLAVVAPGIAEALLATAMGLVAAIPATVAYNKFSAEIAKYGAKLENFANDFISTLSRNIEDSQRGPSGAYPGDSIGMSRGDKSRED